MASDNRIRWHIVPLGWILSALILAFSAGFFCVSGSPLWIFSVVGSAICVAMTMRGITLVNKRLRFIMDATISGDFSYKFPTENVPCEERECNEMLNGIVEHFERLTKEVRRNEVFLARMINLSDIGLAIADSKGDIRLHNEAALRLLDRSAFTNACQIPDQAYIDLSIRKSEVTVNDKSFTLYTISDLSRKMQAVEVESWEKLTRVLTHEIMNSLTPIQSIAETMSGKTSTQDVAEAFLTISSSSRSLMQFVRNFREFSRLPEPQMRVIYVKPLLESCIRMMRSVAKDSNVSITLRCFPPDLMVYTDESMISQVLVNIMKNALDACPAHICVEADEKSDETVEIRISNDGDPISDETAEQIFTPFFTTKESGSGIGLSLSRRIMTHLGGTLILKTRPQTCFSVKM